MKKILALSLCLIHHLGLAHESYRAEYILFAWKDAKKTEHVQKIDRYLEKKYSKPSNLLMPSPGKLGPLTMSLKRLRHDDTISIISYGSYPLHLKQGQSQTLWIDGRHDPLSHDQKIQGHISVGKKQYFETSIDLRYNKALMRQKRRMKRNQVNYFDHPQFGLILRIDPERDLISTLDTPQTPLSSQ